MTRVFHIPPIGAVPADDLMNDLRSHESIITRTPFFVLGCPRSGTTLLQVLLNRHPQVCIPPELKLFFAYYRLPRWSRHRTLQRIRSDLGIPLILEDGARTSVAQVYRRIWHELEQRAGSDCEPILFGDKTPEYTFRLPWLNEVFPCCKAIFLVRDPRDVSLSLQKAPWIQCDLTGASRVWRSTYELLCQAAQRMDRRVHWVRYEDLVSNTPTILREIFEFLDVPVRESEIAKLVHRSIRDRGAVPPRELAWKYRAFDRPDPTRVGAWTVATQAEIHTIESQCHDAMDKAGYIPSTITGRIRGSDRIRWQVRGAISLVRTGVSLPWDCLFAEATYRCRCILPGRGRG